MIDENDDEEEVIKVHQSKSRAQRMAEKEMKTESPLTKSNTSKKTEVMEIDDDESEEEKMP